MRFVDQLKSYNKEKFRLLKSLGTLQLYTPASVMEKEDKALFATTLDLEGDLTTALEVVRDLNSIFRKEMKDEESD